MKMMKRALWVDINIKHRSKDLVHQLSLLITVKFSLLLLNNSQQVKLTDRAKNHFSPLKSNMNPIHILSNKRILELLISVDLAVLINIHQKVQEL